MSLLTLTVFGADYPEKTLDILLKGLNPESILDEAAATVLNRIKTRFVTQVDPEGVPWIPSAAALHEGRNTLLDTGTLYRSIQLFNTGPNTRRISTDVPYAIKHQLGLGVLQRKFMGINDEDVTIVDAVVQKLIQDLLA